MLKFASVFSAFLLCLCAGYASQPRLNCLTYVDSLNVMYSITSMAPHHAVAVGEQGVIRLTTDSAGTARTVRGGIGLAALRSLAHDGAGRLYACGERGSLLTSSDSGATWSSLSLNTDRDYTKVVADPRVVVLSGLDSTLTLRYSDGNLKVHKLSQQVTDIALSESHAYVVLRSGEGLRYSTANPEIEPVTFRSPLTCRNTSLTTIRGVLYLACGDSLLSQSSDKGATWTTTSFDGNSAFPAFLFDENQGGILLLARRSFREVQVRRIPSSQSSDQRLPLSVFTFQSAHFNARARSLYLCGLNGTIELHQLTDTAFAFARRTNPLPVDQNAQSFRYPFILPNKSQSKLATNLALEQNLPLRMAYSPGDWQDLKVDTVVGAMSGMTVRRYFLQSDREGTIRFLGLASLSTSGSPNSYWMLGSRMQDSSKFTIIKGPDAEGPVPLAVPAPGGHWLTGGRTLSFLDFNGAYRMGLGTLDSTARLEYAVDDALVAYTRFEVHVSSDSGRIWVKKPLPSLVEGVIATSTKSRLAFFGEIGRVHTSTDGGATWHIGRRNRGIVQHRSLGDVIAVAGFDSIQVSYDFGVTWYSLPLPRLGTFVPRVESLEIYDGNRVHFGTIAGVFEVIPPGEPSSAATEEIVALPVEALVVPNPASAAFTITGFTPIVSLPCQLRVIDAAGQTTLATSSYPRGDGSIALDLNGVAPPGAYRILITQGARTWWAKLVVMR